jgi:phosphate:Na+ symporter
LKTKFKALETDEELDALYNKKIKYLYGEIIDFATKVQSNSDHSYNKIFTKIKIANRSLVDAVKTMMFIQNNLAKFLKSSNPEMKSQYENIVFNLIKIILEVNELNEAKNKKNKELIYVSIQKIIDENDVITNGTLDSLIRENKISNAMATSLINDSNYKNEIFKNLLQASQVIFQDELRDDDILPELNTETKDKGKHSKDKFVKLK